MEEKKTWLEQKDASGLEVLKKWLHVLYLTQLAELAVLLIGLFRALDGVTSVVSRLISLVVLVALYQLSLVNRRYLKAAGFYLVGLIGTVIQLLWGSNLLTSAASICALVATYQEYASHGELLAGRDPYLADKWNSLFYWGLVVGIVGGFGVMGIAFLGVGAELPQDTVVTLGVLLMLVMEVPLDLLRLKYLKRTRLVLTEE